MGVTNMSDFRGKQEREQLERQQAASRFIMDMWYEAVDKERHLPQALAIKLVEQIMLDHGLTIEDLIARRNR